jgi:hypothetical protein
MSTTRSPSSAHTCRRHPPYGVFAPPASGQYHSAMQTLILLLLLAVPLSAHNGPVAIAVPVS